jgi:hypothetical protein
MSTVNLWHLLPWQAVSLSALMVISLVVAPPGQRRQHFNIAVAAWATVQILILGFGSLFGWIGVVT